MKIQVEVEVYLRGGGREIVTVTVEKDTLGQLAEEEALRTIEGVSAKVKRVEFTPEDINL